MIRRIAIFLGIFLSGEVWAHAKLKPGASLKLREDNPGIKTGPCGSMPRGNNITTLTAGQSLNVEWVETINHPGSFRIAFSPANDTDFDKNILATIPDDKDGTADLPHSFSKTITVPSVVCDNCTIQLIQTMTENPANPSYYYSCADIKIIGTGIEPTVTPLPSASPGQNCD